MARGKKHTPEEIVSLLRQIEVGVANGKTTPAACREGSITEQTYYRWCKEYGGLQVDQARRLKELEQENAKLKRLRWPSRREACIYACEGANEPDSKNNQNAVGRTVYQTVFYGTACATRCATQFALFAASVR